jgi:HEAT repeat protein
MMWLSRSSYFLVILLALGCSSSSRLSAEFDKCLSLATSTSASDRALAARNMGLHCLHLNEESAAFEQGVDLLITMMSDEDKSVRLAAVDAIGEIGLPAYRAIPALRKTIKDPQVGIRCASVCALYGLGPAATSAIPDLLVALEDSDRFIRAQTARALARIAPGRIELVEAIAALLADPEANVRGDVAWALSEVGRNARRVPGIVPALLVGLKDGNGYVCAQTAKALAQIDPRNEEAIDGITTLLMNPDEFVRADAAEALGAIGAPALRSLPMLKQLQDDNDKSVRQEARTAIRSITTTSAGNGS